MPIFPIAHSLTQDADLLRRGRYGRMEMVEGAFRGIALRPWPKIATAWDVWFFGRNHHQRRRGDRLLLYYNQPRRCENFLVLKYVLSTRDTGFATLRRALDVLDEVARLKRSDAILCDVSNLRISPRSMARWGWSPHCPSRWHRHYIKRFYGEYPPRPTWLEDVPGSVPDSDARIFNPSYDASPNVPVDTALKSEAFDTQPALVP